MVCQHRTTTPASSLHGQLDRTEAWKAPAGACLWQSHPLVPPLVNLVCAPRSVVAPNSIPRPLPSMRSKHAQAPYPRNPSTIGGEPAPFTKRPTAQYHSRQAQPPPSSSTTVQPRLNSRRTSSWCPFLRKPGTTVKLHFIIQILLLPFCHLQARLETQQATGGGTSAHHCAAWDMSSGTPAHSRPCSSAPS
jgi:hypothetical protein